MLLKSAFHPALTHLALPLWQQSENVVFEQSRNVVLTASSFGDAGRTTTDDSSRKRPAGGVEEGEKEPDHATGGCGRTDVECTAGAAAAVWLEEGGGQGGGPRV